MGDVRRLTVAGDAEWAAMAIVVRLGPVPLGYRREDRVAELERIFATGVQLVEVFTVAELTSAVATPEVIAVALDATLPGELGDAVAASGSFPVLRPLWLRRRSERGEIDEVFGGYGLLTDAGVSPLADAELRRPDADE